MQPFASLPFQLASLLDSEIGFKPLYFLWWHSVGCSLCFLISQTSYLTPLMIVHWHKRKWMRVN